MTFGELQEKFPYLNWLEYARTFMPSDVTIDENEPVVVGLLEFFEQLEGILKNMDKRTVANYLIWRSIFTVSKNLNKEMLELRLKFSEILDGKKKQEPLHIECIASTTELLPMPVGHLYTVKVCVLHSTKDCIPMTFHHIVWGFYVSVIPLIFFNNLL